MRKLRTLKPSVRRLSTQARQVPTVSEQRITGSRLQARRWKMWCKTPHCQACGRVVDWPYGFELDHKVRLDQGGPDTEENCQVLCVWMDEAGVKRGCHAEKTAAEGSRPGGMS